MKLMKMMPLNELKKKIEHIETERTHLTNEIKKLQIEADKKAVFILYQNLCFALEYRQLFLQRPNFVNQNPFLLSLLFPSLL